MNKISKLFLNLIPIKQWRRIIRNYYTQKKAQKLKDLGILTENKFIYRNNELDLFQSSYNCGFYNSIMTERCVEIAIAKNWLNSIDGEVIEIGAVTPYYLPRAVNEICDPYDPHSKVSIKESMFKLDLRQKNVLSISTIEHVGTGEYGLQINEGETAVNALLKILKESKKCLITFPVGANAELDNYILGNQNLGNDISIELIKRTGDNNCFCQSQNIQDIKNISYVNCKANAVVIIEKFIRE